MHSIRLFAVSALALGAVAHAGGPQFIASTDRVGYSGSVTRFASLADAVGGVNPVGGPFSIPKRNTGAPFNTESRDVGMYFVNDAPSYDPQNSNILLTAWYYSIENNTNGLPKDDPAGDNYYSGNGNPNNTNPGFVQLYDEDGSTDTSLSAAFGGFNGTHWTEFSLQASGANADFDNDFSRLWNADGPNSFPDVTFGRFVSYELDITFKGLEGIDLGGGVIEANNHPTGVVGTFRAVFENTNAGALDDPSYDGFYTVDLSFNMDNWAFAEGDEKLNGNFSPSLFAVVPAPGTGVLAGAIALVGLRRRRSA
jgi:hypothetical protein